MLGFEPRITDVGSDRSANSAATTALRFLVWILQGFWSLYFELWTHKPMTIIIFQIILSFCLSYRGDKNLQWSKLGLWKQGLGICDAGRDGDVNHRDASDAIRGGSADALGQRDSNWGQHVRLDHQAHIAKQVAFTWELIFHQTSFANQ